jgi:CheY-specific phosphatase CheX
MVENAAPGEEPVVGPIRDQLLDPFIAATSAALAEMAGLEVFPSAIVREFPSRAWGNSAAVVQLQSEPLEWLVLSFPTTTASALAHRILADVVEVWDESLIPDSLAEIANVVSGQAKTLLAGTPYHFNFSLPKVVVGTIPEHGPAHGRDCLAVSFQSELGEFVLRLFLKPGISLVS